MYNNTNKGTLGKNKHKQAETHPDYKGKLNIDGVDYWLSAWLKANKETGESFFSLAVKRKDAKPEAVAQTEASGGGALDDDIPFAQFERGSVA